MTIDNDAYAWTGGDRRGKAPPTLTNRFTTVVRDHPDAPAVTDEQRTLPYAQLDLAADRVAFHLRGLGVGPGDFVALRLAPSVELVVAIIAVLRCGAAYIPLDDQSPPARTRLILDDSGARVLIGDHLSADSPPHLSLSADELRAVMGNASSIRPPALDLSEPSRPAYVIYTSGTTGPPKGVPIRHRNLTALFDATVDLFAFDQQDTWLLFHSVAFDFSVWEMWGALLYGGRLVIPNMWVRRSPADCLALVLAEGVTVLNQTPTAFEWLAQIMVARPPPPELRLRYIIFGGERLAPAVLRPWAERFGVDRPALVNMYGLTEATVHTTYRRLQPADLTADESAIGRPLPGFISRIVGADGRPASRGELMVAGPQVAEGYLRRPELTRERFVSDPTGERPDLTFYRTGDLVQTGPDDELLFCGRVDRQVKVRGYRIELGEVEAALGVVPDVVAAAVFKVDHSGGVLVCAYTTRSGRPIPARSLRRSLAARLPPYMFPEQFRWLKSMPSTSNGKTDYKALRKEWSMTEQTVTDIQRALLDWLRQELSDPDVELTDNFLEVGGHSMLAIELNAWLTQQFGASVDQITLFTKTLGDAVRTSPQRAGPLDE